ncbi:MAG: hypothetical protein PVF95_10190 [bacterium]|jgi:hypothetical protein
MAKVEFPPALPAGYREIWTALKAADSESPSRQALARQLGISTHTIQRILIDGNVPDLASTRNTRVLRAWVRIITRLAHRFGREPRIWVEAAGMAWNDAVRDIVDETLNKLAARETALRPELASAGEVEAAIPGVAGYEFPDEISVGVVAGDPLGLRAGGGSHSFLEEYVLRLVGSIRPGCRIGMTTTDEATLAGSLMEPVGGPDFVAGMADTLSLRMGGLDVVGVPGLRIRLAALCLRARSLEAGPPSWLAGLSQYASGDIKYLVRLGDLAHRFLRGQCGIPEERIIAREAENLEDIADTLITETSLWEPSMHLERWVVLVGDEETCHAVRGILNAREEVVRDYSVEQLPGGPRDFPAYQVVLALPARRSEMRDLLRAATRLELFGSGAANTASLYAGLLAAGFMKRNIGNLINPLISNGPHILDEFGAGGVFREVLCRELVRRLADAIDGALTARHLFTTGDAVSAQARFLALEHARSLVPSVWSESLNRAAPGSIRVSEGDMLTVPAMHCQSCSASLLDEHHRGPSERFCRVCSDENGTLRPRAKVEAIIAEWFEHWHGALDHRDALRQAKDFMEKMPAWCSN